MKKKAFLVSVLLCLVLFASGCDNVPTDSIQKGTSIVGQIGNVNKENTVFVVKAYLESAPEKMISKSQADENGYFQVMLDAAGKYILKVDYSYNGKTFLYPQPYTYNEKRVGKINVPDGKVKNVGVIYTSLEDLYVKKALDELNRITAESNQKFKYKAKVDIVNEDNSKVKFMEEPLKDNSYKNIMDLLTTIKYLKISIVVGY